MKRSEVEEVMEAQQLGDSIVVRVAEHKTGFTEVAKIMPEVKDDDFVEVVGGVGKIWGKKKKVEAEVRVVPCKRLSKWACPKDNTAPREISQSVSRGD